MPTPLSRDRDDGLGCRRRATRRGSRRRASVYFAALVSTFATHCTSRAGSPFTRSAPWRGHRELVALLADQRLDRLDGLGDHVRELQRLALELDAALRDARHVEQVVDEPRENADLPLHDVDRRLRVRS